MNAKQPPEKLSFKKTSPRISLAADDPLPTLLDHEVVPQEESH